MNEPAFTPEQIADWHAYVQVRNDGKYNMLYDARSRALTKLSRDEYEFVRINYSALKAAALKP